MPITPYLDGFEVSETKRVLGVATAISPTKSLPAE